MANHVCGECGCATSSLVEHRSEEQHPLVFHPECCPGGCGPETAEDH